MERENAVPDCDTKKTYHSQGAYTSASHKQRHEMSCTEGVENGCISSDDCSRNSKYPEFAVCVKSE